MFTREQIELAKVIFEGSSKSNEYTKEHLKALQISSEALIDSFFEKTIRTATQASQDFISRIEEQTRKLHTAKLPFVASSRSSEKLRLPLE